MEQQFDPQAKPFEHSPQSIRSQLLLDSLHPTDCSVVDEGQYLPFNSILPINEPNNPLDFVTQESPGGYFDLFDSFLHLKCRILRNDNNICDTTDKVAPSNNFFHSLFGSAQFYINNTLVSDQSNSYHVSSYIKNLLATFPAEKQGPMQQQLWYPDSKPDVFDDTNTGWKIRFTKSEKSQVFSVIAKPEIGMLTQRRYLSAENTIRLCLKRNATEIFLDSASATKAGLGTNTPYKIVFVSATFYIKLKTIAPSVIEHHKALLNKNVSMKYPVTEAEVKTFSIPSGLSSVSIDNVITGVVPSFIVVGLVKSSSYSGTLTSSFTRFQHFDLSEMQVLLNNQTVGMTSIPFNFKNTAGNGEDAYLLGLKTLRDCSSIWALSNGIDVDNYTNGNCVVAFSLLPSSGDSLSLNRHGQIKLALKFKTSLADPITVVVLCQNQAIIEIDKFKQVVVNK